MWKSFVSVVYYVAIVSFHKDNCQTNLNLHTRVTAVVCHAVINKKVGLLLQLITNDSISKSFPAHVHTERTHFSV